MLHLEDPVIGFDHEDIAPLSSVVHRPAAAYLAAAHNAAAEANRVLKRIPPRSSGAVWRHCLAIHQKVGCISNSSIAASAVAHCGGGGGGVWC